VSFLVFTITTEGDAIYEQEIGEMLFELDSLPISVMLADSSSSNTYHERPDTQLK
jgi:hypothetical protein